MQKRRFYRIDEINDVTTITKGDLLHAVERSELSLCAWVDAKALGVQLKGSDSNQPALANLFDYRGVLSLTSKQSIECVNSHKTSIERTVIHEPEFLTNWRSALVDYPKAKHVRFSRVTTMTKQPVDSFVAFASIGTAAVLGQRLKELSKAGADEIRKEGLQGMFNAFMDTDEELAIKPLEIGFDSLRFDLLSVHKVFGLDTNQNALQSPIIVNPSVSQRRGRRNRVLDVIERALKANPQGDYHTIHKMIRDEHNEHENKADFSDKTFDVDEVIQKIDSEGISWRMQSGKEKPMKRKYFNDLVTKVRGELGLNKQ
ncbi:hypothetical protein [Enterovibrio calviensis]|uniref:hypothetical protein n=1 Tax=Enterovibrio calviensis TaxID=91359 RepID=UPI000483C83B|nr:hypothetical protein [Enterovibrio calviensis]